MTNRTVPFDIDKLEEVCKAPFATFAKLGEVRRNASTGGRHIFVDRNASILAVAHLDSVRDEFHFFSGVIGRRLHIFNSQLDDRLGVYLLLHPLTQMLGGQAFDILFTENEEKGDSTAIDFATSKQYNWIFSFDRAGTDVVMYQYDSLAAEKRLKAHGLKLARGSYSCIADLDHLGVCGYNIGCGYYDNHSELAYCVWSDTATMVGRFTKFFWAERKNVHTHTPAPYYRHRRSGYMSGWGEENGSASTGSQPRIALPPATGKVILPNTTWPPTEEWSNDEWNQWLAKEEEKIAFARDRERAYEKRHPEYRSERNYVCVVCQTAKFPEEIQLATMTCYSCIQQYYQT